MPEINSWAWLTFKTIAPNQPENLVGYEFDPYATYEGPPYATGAKPFKFRDANDDGKVEAQNQTENINENPANDGVRIDGVAYQISHHWAYNATVEYTDGTKLTNKDIMVMRLIEPNNSDAPLNDPDDPNNTVDTPIYHKRLIFRIHDESINEYYEGKDGVGGNKYPMIEISKITITSYEADQNVNFRSVEDALNDPYPKIICFAGGTLIETDSGNRAVEDLKVGDMVRTVDHGFQPIFWIGSNKITSNQLAANPKLRPVRITAGTLGVGVPARDLMVTRQHRILLQSSVFKDELDVSEVLVPAKDLVVLDGVDIIDDLDGDIVYYHFLCENHEILFAEGTLAESMLTGTEALKALNETAREEIAILIPELQNANYVPSPARMLFAGKRTRNAIKRHVERQESVLQFYC